MPEEPFNVVPLNPDDERELDVARKDPGTYKCGFCECVDLDPVKRIITCRRCGFVVDPFDYLDGWAKEGHRFMSGLNGLKARTRILRAQHDDLERRVKNLRATLKRAGHPQTAKEKDEWDHKEWLAQNAPQKLFDVVPE